MYRHPDSQLCFRDSVHKDWIIEVVEDNFTITNELIYKDEIEFHDNLCSKEDITLGACESVEFDFKVTNTGRTYKDKTIVVSLVLNNHTSTPIPIGKFKVEEEELEEDQRVRSIKAYDALHEINTKDFAPWFNNLTHDGGSITCKEFRDSFFEYAGIEQEEVELINDWVPFTFTVTNSSATQRMIDEEKEKRNQAVKRAEYGIPTTKYELIDPATYDDYKTTEEYKYRVVYQPEYLEVTPAMKTEGVNPHREGWYEKNKKKVYFLTVDTELDPNHTYYYIKDPVDPSPTPSPIPFDPHAHSWYILDSKTGSYSITEDHTIVRTKTYYEQYEVITRRPCDLQWFVVQDGEYVPTIDTEIKTLKNYYKEITIDPPKPKYAEFIMEEGVSYNPNELKLFKYDASEGRYVRATETTPEYGVTYYQLVSVENNNTAFLELNLNAYRVDNPKEKGWYEFVNDAYVKTEDTTIDFTKKYYYNIYEELLKNDNDVVEDQIQGSEIIQAICEINGCFGHMSREGKFRYVKTKPIDYADLGLYPASDLYPDPNLYPAGAPADQEITRSYYEDITRSDYLVKKIDRLVICKEDGDAGYVYPADSLPDGHNTYKVTGNFIWYSFTGDKATLDLVGQNLLTQGVAQISEYTPCSIDMMGNPCIEVGDTIKIHTRTGDIYTYVMTRTLKGSQRLKDTIEAKGSRERTSENSLYDAVIELKGKSNILTRTVDETRSEIIDVSEGLSSLISQTADQITLSVSKDIKNIKDQTTTVYKSLTEYTDEKIKDTVSKTLYDENNVELSQSMSMFERTAEKITAEVSKKVNANGENREEGFKWDLESSGFTLSCLGGYKDITSTLTPTTQLQNMEPTVMEVNSQTQSLIATPDVTPKDHKSYYQARQSSDWDPVFVVNRAGAWMKNALTVQNLDVRSVATIEYVVSTKAEITELLADYAEIEQLDALRGEINTIVAREISSAYIQADHITGGTIDSNRISVSTLKGPLKDTLRIIASSSSPYEGKMVIGNIGVGGLGRFFIFVPSGSGSGAINGSYYPLKEVNITIGSRSYSVLALDKSKPTSSTGIPSS